VYEIVGSLGAGGMGEVYQARDTRLDRPVAIKFVSDELAADRTASERLEREARLTSLLNHPNIVTVHDVGELDGRPYIVMELVAGQSLHSALQRERLKPRRVIEIATQIADGLAVAHAAGIVHRDLKPRNIMLTTDGRAKIVDFGVGKTSRPAPGAEDPTAYGGRLTGTLVVVGTAGYMAPEQVTSKAIDFRADQFALGAIIYEMITGRRAFKRETPVQTMAAIVDSEPELIDELAGDTPIELLTVVERCLAKDPANRYASTQDLARDLREIPLGTGVRTPRSSVALKRVPRRRWRWMAGLAVLLAVAAALPFLRADRTRTQLAQARALLDRFDKQPNVDQAIGLLSAIVSASPKDHAARTWLAEAYLRKFEYVPSDQTLAARAGEEAGVALTLKQSYAPVHVVLAMINYSQGRFDGALGEAQNAVALDARYSRAWRERARALVRLGRRDEAEKDFLSAVALDPGDWTSRRITRARTTISAVRSFSRNGSTRRRRCTSGPCRWTRTRPRTPTSARRCSSRAGTPTRPARSKGPWPCLARRSCTGSISVRPATGRRIEGARKRRTKPRSGWASRREPPRAGSIPPAWQIWPPPTRCWRSCRPVRKRRSIGAGPST
jgi:serine/threonine protein kinase